MAKHHKETLNFTGPGYYGALSTEDGFGGFNYSPYVQYVNESYWNIVQWCDNGYTNVTTAAKDAVGCAYVYDDGVMESANLKETFSLTSMIAASAWDTGAVWDIKSYVYSHGTLKLKASDTMTIGQTATRIDFATLGAKGDFTNIAAVAFQLSSQGRGGYNCTGEYATGYQIAFDALKVKWNGKIPAGGGNHKTFLPPGLANHHHHVIPLFAAHVTHSGAHADTSAATHTAAHHNDGGYHSQLLSLPGHDPGGLTTQVHLPVVEHFGS